jgi:hypothetical protein
MLYVDRSLPWAVTRAVLDLARDPETGLGKVAFEARLPGETWGPAFWLGFDDATPEGERAVRVEIAPGAAAFRPRALRAALLEAAGPRTEGVVVALDVDPAVPTGRVLSALETIFRTPPSWCGAWPVSFLRDGPDPDRSLPEIREANGTDEPGLRILVAGRPLPDVAEESLPAVPAWKGDYAPWLSARFPSLPGR